MKELFKLAGHYNLSLSFDEQENMIYASTSTATSILAEDLKKIKEITGAEKAELYADNNTEEDNFLIQLQMPNQEN